MKKKTPPPYLDGFIDDLANVHRRNNTNSLQTLPENRRENPFHFFSKVSIALISKSKKDVARTENQIESSIPKNITEGDHRRRK